MLLPMRSSHGGADTVLVEALLDGDLDELLSQGLYLRLVAPPLDPVEGKL